MLDLPAPELPGLLLNMVMPSQERRGPWRDAGNDRYLWTPTSNLPSNWGKTSDVGTPAVSVLTNGYLTLSPVLSLGLDWTLSVRARFSALPGDQILVGGSTNSYLMYFSAGMFNCAQGGSSSTNLAFTPAIDRWYTFALINNGSAGTRSFWVDGRQRGNTVSIGTASPTDLKYLGNWNPLNIPFNGHISSCKVFGRALQPHEIPWIHAGFRAGPIVNLLSQAEDASQFIFAEELQPAYAPRSLALESEDWQSVGLVPGWEEEDARAYAGRLLALEWEENQGAAGSRAPEVELGEEETGGLTPRRSPGWRLSGDELGYWRTIVAVGAPTPTHRFAVRSGSRFRAGSLRRFAVGPGSRLRARGV